ncbi:MAG: type II secretion system ATPase GspE [Desulfarculaceae bacterium]|jgi:type II secretion system protein E
MESRQEKTNPVLSLKESFGPYLVSEGILTPAQWSEVSAQGQYGFADAAHLIIGMGYMSEGGLLRELSAYTGLPQASDIPAPSALSPINGLPYQYLKKSKIVPLGRHQGVIYVAVMDPFAQGPLAALSLFTGSPVQICLESEERILRKIEADYGLGGQGVESLGQEGFSQADMSFGISDMNHLEDLSSEAPIIRLFNFLLDRAVAMDASDIHIEPQENHLKVRYRIDGRLQEVNRLDKKFQNPVTSRIKILAKLNIAERRLPQDGQIMLRVGGRNLDLRVSTMPTSFGESVVLRLLYRETLKWELSDLGINPEQLSQLEGLIERPHGLLLVTGPTGSGKTTTLYCALKKISSPDKKIVTIEDPVEYRLPGVNQIQVNPQIGVTFSSGLRSIVRQDPDIILVGEIRDLETASIAIHAALTGHLVFSTLHTTDAPGAITRLQDMGVDSFLISSALTAVVAQRLVRKLCPNCRQAATVPGSALERQGIKGQAEDIEIFRGQGCPACNQQGYRGRTGIYEFLEITDPVRSLISQQKPHEVLRQAAEQEGMLSLRQQGWRLVKRGSTSLEELLRVTTI